jgi:hypothetical protein
VRDQDVRCDLPDDPSPIRLADMLCIERNHEWLSGRPYLSAESIAVVVARRNDYPDKEINEEVAQLQAA